MATDYSAVGRKSKRKGASFELKTAKALGAWWEDEFQRTPASGGLRWKSDNNVIGDIVASPSSRFPFVVECKHREGNWTLESLVIGKHEIKDWWAQVVEDGRRGHKTPLLMFTRNYAETFVMIPFKQEVYDTLVDKDLPVMRTHVKYTDKLSEVEERFDVLVTTLAGLTSFDKQYWIENPMKDWDEQTRLSSPIEPKTEEEVVEDFSDMLEKLKKI